MQFNDTARPRYLPITRGYQIELEYVLRDESVGQMRDEVAAKDVVNSRGISVSEDTLIRLARTLTRTRAKTEEGALRALLAYALEQDTADRHVEIAESDDTAADLLDSELTTADLWESCFGGDPESPEAWRMDDEAISDYAASESAARYAQHPTVLMMDALNRTNGF